ncbi:MAG: histidine phosphatase family protein [Luteolibacter sp.]|jgi:phosphohistidine phosphatase|nr:histidine phosphatase family protein [Luteolibacter sp.]
MDLILLRHGKAEDFHADGDSFRELAGRGREQAHKAARLLKDSRWLPEIVLTSPLVRARQTADEFCETASLPGAVIQGWLACGMHPEGALRELAGFSEFKRIAIVGHEPDLSRLIEWLLGTSGGGVDMKKGAIACLRINPPSRHGLLKFLIPPKLADETG